MSSLPYESGDCENDWKFRPTWGARGQLRRVPIDKVYTCQHEVEFGHGSYSEKSLFDPELDRPTRSKKRGVLRVPQAGLVKVGPRKTIIALANGNHRFMDAVRQGFDEILLRFAWTSARERCPLCWQPNPTRHDSNVYQHFHLALDSLVDHYDSNGDRAQHHGKKVRDIANTKIRKGDRRVSTQAR